MLDNVFENHTKNQRENLLNGSDIYGIHFQGDGAIIKDTNILNILNVGVYLSVSVQKIVDCTGHITGGHKKDDTFVAERRKLWNYIFLMDPVCAERLKKY